VVYAGAALSKEDDAIIGIIVERRIGNDKGALGLGQKYSSALDTGIVVDDGVTDCDIVGLDTDGVSARRVRKSGDGCVGEDEIGI